MTRLLPLLLSVALLACGSSGPTAQTPVAKGEPIAAAAPEIPDASPSPWAPPPPTKTTGCTARGPLPDPACTPGAIETRDLAVICGESTRARRHVPAAVHRAVFAAYGVPYPAPEGTTEVDHLIPLALGGSNDVANLWLESAPGYQEKDRLEVALHRGVCAGRMPLAEAQRAIAEDWVGAAKRLQTRPEP